MCICRSRYCFPLLVLFKFSIIDVRKKKWTNLYPVTMITTVVWLACMAEGMMTGAETAGCIMEIPEDVMGLTIAAAGTSLPNLFVSTRREPPPQRAPAACCVYYS